MQETKELLVNVEKKACQGILISLSKANSEAKPPSPHHHSIAQGAGAKLLKTNIKITCQYEPPSISEIILGIVTTIMASDTLNT